MEVMKQLRQRAIRDLLEQRPIRTQQELAAALRERGFRTTQATISRDVAELGLVKSSQDGVQAYARPGPRHRGREHRRGAPPRAPARPARGDPRGRPDARPADAARLRARHRGRARPHALARGRRAASPATTRCSSLRGPRLDAADPREAGPAGPLSGPLDAPRARSVTDGPDFRGGGGRGRKAGPVLLVCDICWRLHARAGQSTLVPPGRGPQSSPKRGGSAPDHAHPRGAVSRRRPGVRTRRGRSAASACDVGRVRAPLRKLPALTSGRWPLRIRAGRTSGPLGAPGVRFLIPDLEGRRPPMSGPTERGPPA